MRLLLAIDGSMESTAAVRAVSRRPWPSDSRVRVLHVVDTVPGSPPKGIAVPSAPLAETSPWPVGTLGTDVLVREAAKRLTQTAIQALEACGLACETCVRDGAVGPGIVEEARAWNADLVVVGSRAHGAIMRFLLGSVASHVVQNAPCSVEVVRERRG
jgi:nucleotide-binding universal stress UspA family protein